jgi:hypothetical protein
MISLRYVHDHRPIVSILLVEPCEQGATTQAIAMERGMGVLASGSTHLRKCQDWILDASVRFNRTTGEAGQRLDGGWTEAFWATLRTCGTCGPAAWGRSVLRRTCGDVVCAQVIQGKWALKHLIGKEQMYAIVC